MSPSAESVSDALGGPAAVPAGGVCAGGRGGAVNPRGSLLISGAVAALGGAVTYLCALAAYAQVSVPAAVLVGAVAAGQAALAVALLLRPSRRLIAAAAAAAAGFLVLWLVTRTAGPLARQADPGCYRPA